MSLVVRHLKDTNRFTFIGYVHLNLPLVLLRVAGVLPLIFTSQSALPEIKAITCYIVTYIYIRLHLFIPSLLVYTLLNTTHFYHIPDAVERSESLSLSLAATGSIVHECDVII